MDSLGGHLHMAYILCIVYTAVTFQNPVIIYEHSIKVKIKYKEFVHLIAYLICDSEKENFIYGTECKKKKNFKNSFSA
jgi:hypothetical protein